MTDRDVAREKAIAARIASLISAADVELDVVAADLTSLYRASIPVYDQVASDEIERNTRAVLDIVVAQVRSDCPSVNSHDIIELVRLWADQRIPLELVAHSIQLGARELFKLVRHEATHRDLSSESIDDMQDMMWDWATSYSAAVNSVMQERAVSGAVRRADLVRQLVEGSYVPAALEDDSREHRIVLDHEYHVACVVWNDSPVVSDVRAMLRIRCGTDTVPVVDAVIDRHLVALLPTLPDGLDAPVPVGVGSAARPAEAMASHREARHALDLATSFGKSGVLDLAALGPLPLLALGDDNAAQLVAAHLSPLLERGAAGREIMDTVATYLDNDRRVDDTAARLFLHRNTVRNRVTRFAELTGLDIDRTSDLVLAWWLLVRERTTREDPTLQ